MDTVRERIEPAPGRAGFDGECAVCGIRDCGCQHGVCSADAETGLEAENAA
jgi:hypothetical protein